MFPTTAFHLSAEHGTHELPLSCECFLHKGTLCGAKLAQGMSWSLFAAGSIQMHEAMALALALAVDNYQILNLYNAILALPRKPLMAKTKKFTATKKTRPWELFLLPNS